MIDAIEVLNVLWLVLAVVVGIFGLLLLGKKIGDLQYQVQNKINGILRIQSLIAIRVQAERVLLSAAFFVTILLILADGPIEIRTWASRILFVVVMLAFAIFTVMDWIDDWRQTTLMKAANELTPGGGIHPTALGLGEQFQKSKVAMLVAELGTGSIVAVNERAEQMLGYEPNTLTWQPLTSIIPPRYHEHHLQGVATYLRTGHGRFIDSDQLLNLPALRNDGTEVMVYVTINPIAKPLASGSFVTAIFHPVPSGHERGGTSVDADLGGGPAAPDVAARVGEVLRDD